jgi:hypothetical protein
MSGQAALDRRAAPGTREAWLTRGQMTLRAVQFGLLAALFVVLLAIGFERTSLLFRDPLGQKMVGTAGALLAVGLVLSLLGCVCLNQAAPAGNETLQTRRLVLSVLLEAAHFLLFYLPAVFVLLIGPAAIQIVRTMAQP